MLKLILFIILAAGQNALQHLETNFLEVKDIQRRLSEHIKSSAKENQDIKEEIARISSKLDDIVTLISSKHTETYGGTKPSEIFKNSSIRNTYNTYGCDLDLLSLSCPSQVGGVINVTQAYYGQWAASCESCCPPSPAYDCMELLSESRPTDWAAMKLLCNNQTHCQFQNKGSLVETCMEPYYADYLMVYWDCVGGGDPSTSVAFAAYASQTNSYSPGDVLQFDKIITNTGFAYNGGYGVFMCPRPGIYLFSATLMQEGLVNRIRAVVSREGDYIGASSLNDQGSVTTVVECNENERVSMVMVDNGRIQGDADYPLTIFSGALIEPFKNYFL